MPLRATIITVITTLAVVLGICPGVADNQPVGGILQLGTLNLGPPPSAATYDARRDVVVALRELGYVEGRNLKVERRNAGGRAERLPGLAAELVQRGVHVIVAGGFVAVRAARDATKTIPIVMLIAGPDPVDLGLAASLARTGGNLTGIVLGTHLAEKRLELLREAVPRSTTIAMLFAGEGVGQAQVEEANQAAARLRINLVAVEVEGRDYEKAFTAVRGKRADALFVGASPRLHADRDRIIELAARYRLPAIYQFPEHAEEGGLMAYGMSGRWATKRVAVYVDRIFKGTKPADLPVEQAVTLTLALNLRTAKSLGVSFPQSLLLRADQLIE